MANKTTAKQGRRVSRRRKQMLRRRRLFITGLISVIIIITAIIIILNTGNSTDDAVAPASAPTATPAPVHDTASPTEAPTEEPTEEPSDDEFFDFDPSAENPAPEATAATAEPTAEATAEPAEEPAQAPAAGNSSSWHTYPSDANADKLAKEVKPDVEEGFLPVCYGCKTDEKVLAFTIDDCNQPDNLQAIIDLFIKYGGKATIFPIGENVERCSKELLYARENGFEIENHTWNHSGLYPEDDAGLARQISGQNAAVSKLLGVNYQMHFLRPRGGDNRYDQRTHAYLRQYGYYGIAYWTHVGVKQSNDTLVDKASKGDIYLFHTTDDDLRQLREIVPKLANKGYRFVTMNELYGLPDNETGEYTALSEPEPLEPYTRFPQTLHPEEYLHDVYLMQEKLTELGFLNQEYNGYYGKATKNAVIKFQKSRGLEADGICGDATWKALFGE